MTIGFAGDRSNRRYYRSVAERLAGLPIGRLILFLEGEPLGRFPLTIPAGVVVRDRFETRDRVMLPPVAPATLRDEFLLIGSPLVGDGLIGAARFAEGLRALAAAAPLPVRYFPHLREARRASAGTGSPCAPPARPPAATGRRGTHPLPDRATARRRLDRDQRSAVRLAS